MAISLYLKTSSIEFTSSSFIHVCVLFPLTSNMYESLLCRGVYGNVLEIKEFETSFSSLLPLYFWFRAVVNSEGLIS